MSATGDSLIDSALISGDHRAQLLSDGIHAVVVLVVVLAATVVTLINAKVVPSDVLGTVYGGAIGYAAGRAGNVARMRR